MSLWYGGLYVVIEGWKELGLSDPHVDDLLRSSNVELLKRYRHGTFHFQRDLSPAGSRGTSSSGISGYQGATRWRENRLRRATATDA